MKSVYETTSTFVVTFFAMGLMSTQAWANSAVIVAGGNTGETTEVILDAAIGKLRQRGWIIRYPERDVQADELKKCVARGRACFKRKLGVIADAIVILRIRNHDGLSRQLSGILVDGATGKQLGQSIKNVSDGEMETLRSVAVRVVAELLDQVPGLKRAVGDVTISVTPAPGYVTVDGRNVGPSDLELPLTVGPHQIRVFRKGYHSVTRKITVSRGSKKIRIRLRPDSTGFQHSLEQSESQRSGRWKWAALGAGVASTAVGITLIATQNPDDHDNRTPRLIASGAGAIATGVGIRLIGTGVYMLLSERNKRGPKKRIVVQPNQSGNWSVSIGGTF